MKREIVFDTMTKGDKVATNDEKKLRLIVALLTATYLRLPSTLLSRKKGLTQAATSSADGIHPRALVSNSLIKLVLLSSLAARAAR
jgi:hypothetical protein